MSHKILSRVSPVELKYINVMVTYNIMCVLGFQNFYQFTTHRGKNHFSTNPPLDQILLIQLFFLELIHKKQSEYWIG